MARIREEKSVRTIFNYQDFERVPSSIPKITKSVRYTNGYRKRIIKKRFFLDRCITNYGFKIAYL